MMPEAAAMAGLERVMMNEGGREKAKGKGDGGRRGKKRKKKEKKKRAG